MTGVDSGRNEGNPMGRSSGKTSNTAHARACRPKDVRVVNPRRERSSHDELIVLATPLSATADLLHVLARRAPRGLIFDLGSLKTPLRAGLDALVKAGCRATSVHPMFGPDTELLSGRHVIFIDLGNAAALAEAQAASSDLNARRRALLGAVEEEGRRLARLEAECEGIERERADLRGLGFEETERATRAEAVAELRRRHDIEQLTPMQFVRPS